MDKTVGFEELYPVGTTSWALAQDTAAIVGPARMAKCREFTAYVLYGANTTAGVVTVESAPFAEYTGTWVSLGTAAWTTANKAHSVSGTGVHGAIRIRVSTPVAGSNSIRVFWGGN